VPPRDPGRDAEIVAAVAAGRGVAEVARDHGITRERVRQVVAAAADPDGARARRRRAAARQRASARERQARGERGSGRRDPALAERDAAIVAAVLAGATYAQAAAAHGLSWPYVGEIVRASGVDLRAAGPGRHAARARAGLRPPGPGRRWTPQATAEALRAAAAHAAPAPLTTTRYRALVADGTVDGPSASLIAQRAGGWAAALHAAGLPAPAAAARGGSRWTTQDMLAWVGAALADGVATADGYAAWARSHPGAPSAAALTARVRWSAAVAEAAARAQPPPPGQPRRGGPG